MFNKFILSIKRRETPMYDTLYRCIKYIRSFNFPVVKVVHLPLYKLHVVFTRTLVSIWNIVWHIPLFKARCESCGNNIKLPNGMPYIQGDHLKITIGEGTSILRSTFASGHVYDAPRLDIGKNVSLGYGTIISVADGVEIGNDVEIAANCFIADNDGHPVDSTRRENHESVNIHEIGRVVIGHNVWIGVNCVILKGVNIGHNSVIGANSVITKDVLPDTVVVGTLPRKTISIT